MTHIPDHLRRLVMMRAASRCEYCHLHEDNTYFSHEIDHIYAEKHGGATIAENLCLACADCNRYKGSDLASIDPDTGLIVPLFHPRQNQWSDHFILHNTGVIEPLTSTGRVTTRLLKINRLDLIAERARLLVLERYPESG